MSTSKVRTNKLYCSNCKRKLNIGELADFIIEFGKLKDVLCEDCGNIDYEFDRHPFDLD